MNNQLIVKNFINEHSLICDLQLRMLDLISEVGELSKEVLKGTDYGKCDMQITDDFKMELGDVFFSLCCVANEANIDMDNALFLALQKYEKRIEEKNSAGSENN